MCGGTTIVGGAGVARMDRHLQQKTMRCATAGIDVSIGIEVIDFSNCSYDEFAEHVLCGIPLPSNWLKMGTPKGYSRGDK